MNLEEGNRCLAYAVPAADHDSCNNKSNHPPTTGSIIYKQDPHHYYSTTDLLMMTKGQWTPEEDLKLITSVSIHGPQHWTYLARSAGLKRSGKSCRLRWLNYLRPDVKRGNLTLHEQILILQLHCQFGNKWSKIAQHLPGRTDNEIKNYWRTRVEKLAKQHFNCHANTLQFREAILHVCLPVLTHQLQLQQQQQQQQVVVHPPQEAVSHEKFIPSTSSRVQPTTDDYHNHRTEEDYCCVNSSTTFHSPGSEVANPLNGSWITTYLNSDNQYGTPIHSKYPHEQPLSQISDLLLPSMSSSLLPTTTSSSSSNHKQADYFQSPLSTNSLHIPSRIGDNGTTAASSSSAGELPCFDDDDSQFYYHYCSSWWLGDDDSDLMTIANTQASN